MYKAKLSSSNKKLIYIEQWIHSVQISEASCSTEWHGSILTITDG